MPTDVIQPVVQQNPFPGLRPFEEPEARLFFGREQEITALLGRMMRQHFLAVLGSSGCGKSSLIKAGLIPSLKYELMDDDESAWRVAVMRPGNNPFKQLACALTAEAALGKYRDKTEAEIPIAQMILRRGAFGIVEIMRETELPPEAKLLVLVDQFEELFRFPERAERASALDEARAFVNLLLAAASQRDWPIYIVLTMRSEFLGQCAAFRGLAEAITDGLYLLPDMTRDHLREVIQQPIAMHDGKISERLVNRLLNDLGGNVDQLPILQHALMRLWTYWEPSREVEPIDLRHYEFVGELKGSLSAHAEAIYQEELLSDREKELAEIVFRSLTETTAEGQTVRKPTKLKNICRRAKADVEELKSVIEQFRAEGRSFLMPPCGVSLDEETTIDISHESLIRQWKRLSDWAEIEANEMRLCADLKRSADSWKENNKNPAWLYRGMRLAEAKKWAASHAEMFDDSVIQEFLGAGTELELYAGLVARVEKWHESNFDDSLLLRGMELEEGEAMLKKAELSLGTSSPIYNATQLPMEKITKFIRDSRKARRRVKVLWTWLVVAFLLILAFAYYAYHSRNQVMIEAAKTEEQRVAAADAQTALAEARLGEIHALKRQLGIEDSDDQHQQSDNAGIEIEKLRELVKDREAISIRYFKYSDDVTNVEATLEAVGYQVTTVAPRGKTPTNAIWWGNGIDLQDVQFIVYTLIKNGIEIRYIGKSEKQDEIIQIGGRPQSIRSPFWTVERVRSLNALPVDNEGQ